MSLRLIFGFVLTLTLAMPAAAQTDTPILTQTAEYDIGFDCPSASTLDAAGAVVWVLMENCGHFNHHVLAFNVADGTPVTLDDDFAPLLTGLDDSYVENYNNPLAFTADGNLSVYYTTPEDYVPTHVGLPVAGAVSAEGLSNDELSELLSSYSEYPETTIFNADHTLALALGTSDFHLLDLLTGEEMLTMGNDGLETFNAFPAFSDDGQSLYITRLNEPDNFEVSDSVLSVYSLPDGELTATYEVPSFSVWVSPNGQYAVVRFASNNIGDWDDLAVIDLATGAISERLTIIEEPHKVMTCLDNGNDVSDVDFTASGRLALSGLNWLPDSSGFVTVNSYRGEAAGGGSGCIFDYSRLRVYSVN